MNRGLHEGYNGIVYYSYTKDNDTLTELFFIPSPKSYEKIRLEVEELCVKSDNNLFYIKQNDTVIAVEMNSLEIMEIASDLEEGTFITNDTQTCAAWIEDGKYTSRTIRTLDTKSGVNRSYQADEGEAIRPIGFIGEDMIIGRCKIGDLWKQGNRVISLPMYKLEILDKDLGLSLEYGQPGLYIENVSLTEARLLFDLYRKTDSGEFIKTDADTIVSRDEKLYDKASLVGRTTSGNKKNVYYIALTSEIKNTKKLKVRGVANISYENSGTVEIRSREDKDSLLFYAYSGGELIGRTPSFTDAVNMCYDGMGWVADKNGVVIYNRTNKGSYRKISEPFVKAQPMINRLPDFAGNVVTDDGYIILDGEGLTLNQVLVFIYKNNPVAALNRDGSYYLIYGYNQTTVELYYHQADDTSITLQMSREDFEAKFAAENSIFVCYTSLGK
ncbi:MAG: hypothetical protein Q4B67_04000 [Eubacteriales bacterium]|nr:hypothetical protein [Eubacteriales bacterium]